MLFRSAKEATANKKRWKAQWEDWCTQHKWVRDPEYKQEVGWQVMTKSGGAYVEPVRRQWMFEADGQPSLPQPPRPTGFSRTSSKLYLTINSTTSTIHRPQGGRTAMRSY